MPVFSQKTDAGLKILFEYGYVSGVAEAAVFVLAGSRDGLFLEAQLPIRPPAEVEIPPGVDPRIELLEGWVAFLYRFGKRVERRRVNQDLDLRRRLRALVRQNRSVEAQPIECVAM